MSLKKILKLIYICLVYYITETQLNIKQLKKKMFSR